MSTTRADVAQSGTHEPTDWRERLLALMDGATHTPITPFTEITGAQWRAFYCKAWPKEFYIDDFRVDFEDDHGNFILSDTARHPLEAFGFAVWQSSDSFDSLKSGVMVDMYLLFAAVMGDAASEQDLMTFAVPSGQRAALIAAATSLGARHLT